MSYPLVEGGKYVIDIPPEWSHFCTKSGIIEVTLKRYKWFNDAPLGTECYSTDGLTFCPEWIIRIGAFSLENE